MDVKKLFDVSDKVVILTGASGLLGTEFAKGLSEAGASVVLVDKNYSRCKELAAVLRKEYGVKTLPLKVDVTNKESVRKMVRKTLRRFSKIDALVNNAAFQESKKDRLTSLEKFPLKSWNRAISVNMTGVLFCCQEVGKIMKKQNCGTIVNIGSIYGLVAADQRIYGKSGVNSSVVYASTKASLVNFTRYLASYWHNTGIRVNTLSLGGVQNNQDQDFIKNYSHKTMLGRMARKEEYTGALLFLISDASSYMTGSNLIVDGGWTAW